MEVIHVVVVRERLKLKRIIAVSNVMALSVQPAHDIEKRVEEPMEYKQHFDLLPEMDFFMPHKLRLILRLFPDPDENEKGQTGVIIEYFVPGIDLIRQHT